MTYPDSSRITYLMSDTTKTQRVAQRAMAAAKGARSHLTGDSLRAWVNEKLLCAEAAAAKGATDDERFYRMVAKMASR